jgi:glutamate-1-semialdehyde 2,1-aminomutase
MSALRLARGATGRSKIVKFEGCYHGHADALLVKAGSGLATFGHPTSAGVPRRGGAAHPGARVQQPGAARRGLRHPRREIACVMIEPIAGNMNFVRASVPFMTRLRELCTQHGALLVFDEVMTGFRVALGGAQARLRAADPRLQARHERVRQGHRRRHAAGGLRRHARRDGAARAAGPGLPGRHAQRQPGGHRLRPGHAARDHAPRLLRRAGGPHARWCDGLESAGREAGVPLVGDSEGGMFGFFFAESLPQNYGA